jgi:hypothetical protein
MVSMFKDSRVKVRVEIEGYSAMAEITNDPQVQANVDDIAESVLDMQQSLVPVDTGHLKSRLRIRKTSGGRGREVGAFDVDYAAAVEEGHETKSGTWVPAQPYIRPSVDAVARRLNNG